MPKLRNTDWRAIEFPKYNLMFEPGGELEVTQEVADLLGGVDMFPAIEIVTGGPPPPPPIETNEPNQEGDTE